MPLAELPGVVLQCAEKRVHGLVVISAGFAEVGPEGTEAERELVALARGSPLTGLGPPGVRGPDRLTAAQALEHGEFVLTTLYRSA